MAISSITTISGHHFDPLHPAIELISIADIAHASARLCRGNGHVKEFYSVAQHSIACTQEAAARGLTPRVQLACLLHDAAEAYLCDLIRPIKEVMPQYVVAELNLLEMIWKKYLGCVPSETERMTVFAIDNDMMSYEFHHLMAEDINDDWRHILAPVRCAFRPFADVQSLFENLAADLIAECRGDISSGIDGAPFSYTDS